MTHTPEAINAATAIMNGQQHIETSRGRKSGDGIADLIDTETNLYTLKAENERLAKVNDGLVAALESIMNEYGGTTAYSAIDPRAAAVRETLKSAKE